jgi:hypothetical protein
VCAQAAQVAQSHHADLAPDVRSFTADLYNTWGIIDIRRNEIIKALEHFRRAYTLNPNMFEAWVNYGTINLSFRGYQDAKEAFEHAIALRDDSYDAHIGLGVALRGLALTQPDTERDADARPGAAGVRAGAHPRRQPPGRLLQPRRAQHELHGRRDPGAAHRARAAAAVRAASGLHRPLRDLGGQRHAAHPQHRADHHRARGGRRRRGACSGDPGGDPASGCPGGYPGPGCGSRTGGWTDARARGISVSDVLVQRAQRSTSMKKIVAMAVMGVAMSLGGSAMAQTPPAAGGAQAGAQRTQEFNFTDELVQGQLVRPDGETSRVRRRSAGISLIRIREHFIPEMLKSVENL